MTDEPTKTAGWRLRAHDVRVGLHPNERVYRIHEADGSTAESIAWSIPDGTIAIGYPVGQRADGAYLVELPHETTDGRWRVWVKLEELAS